MNQHWSRLFGYFLGILALSVVVFFLPNMFGGAWLPESITPEGDRVDGLFWGLVIVSGVILAIVMAIVVYSLIHFRAESGDTSDGEPIHGNHRIETIWTVIPAIIVIVIGWFSYDVLVKNEQRPTSGESMTVFVRGYSFGWGFRAADKFYANDQLRSLEVAGKGPAQKLDEAAELVLPVNTTVRFQVMSCNLRETVAETDVLEKELREPGPCVRRFGEPDEAVVKEIEEKAKDPNYVPGQSGDVNHAFWVPEARLKIDSVAGLPSWTQWKPTKVTTSAQQMQVVCAELCGSGHNNMRTDVCVVSRDVYAWWTEELAEGNAVPCSRLRYTSCRAGNDYSKLDETITTLLAKKPEATCEDLEEERA
jgi:cytochrome c oxidase subunit 2